MAALNHKTGGLCQVCYSVVPARIYEEQGHVLIRKHCPRHGSFTGVVEKNVGFYRWFEAHPPRGQLRITTLSLPVTYRCDLNCQYCYAHYPDRPDRTFGVLSKIVKAFPGNSIVLTGGEPTLRKDLPLIIKMVKDSGKDVILETNGLRLADRDYLRRLKEAGLDEVLFSLCSLRDSFYRKISKRSRGVLAGKKAALLNLEREKIKTVLSVTVYPGLNDREVRDLFVFAKQRDPFITQLRFRSCAAVGCNAKTLLPSYTFSGLFRLFAQQMLVDEEDLKTRFLKTRLGRSVVLDFRDLEVKIIGWPTAENIDLEDLKTTMAYQTHRGEQLKFFHGVVVD